MTHVDRIQVVVLHSDPVIQAGLSAAFGRYSDFEIQKMPAGLDKAATALHVTRGCRAHVVVADYANGFVVAAEAARQDGPATVPKVLVVAEIDREWEIRSALERGVRGYILVGCSLDELADGVRAVHRGARHLSPQVAARLAESVAIEPLTMREEEVLRLVVEGMCNKSIGRRLGIALGTVKSHLKSVFGKLDVESRTQAVAVVERRGLLCQPRRAPAAQTLAKTATPQRLPLASGAESRQRYGDNLAGERVAA